MRRLILCRLITTTNRKLGGGRSINSNNEKNTTITAATKNTKKNNNKLLLLDVERPSLESLEKEIINFECRCHKSFIGGCFKKNFIDCSRREETFGTWHHKMLSLLQLFREKTLIYGEEDLETHRLRLFRTYCTNKATVIDPTEAEENFLNNNNNGGESFCHPCDSSVSSMTLSSCSSRTNNILEHQKFKFDWSVDVSKGFLPDSKTKLKLCRESFCFLYGISVNSMKRISRSMKNANSLDITSAKTPRNYDHQTYFGDETTVQELMDIFQENDLHFGLDEKVGLLRSTNCHVDAYIWMQDYFFRFEHQPNSKQIHLDTTFKRSIWEEYCKMPSEKLGTDLTVLSEGSFKFLWDSLFNYVKIRKEKRVTGKCWTCAYINELRMKQKGREVGQACKHLMIMHRAGFFMLERLEYRRRVHEAVIYNPTSVMSTIIDGASQNHCTLPHAGPNAQFTNGLEQHIEGALTHGHNLTIYRSFPTVKADSDFTIYCLLEELRKWTAANRGVYPDTWYIQIDGGSENANQYLFAAMEYLCIKRLCKRIILTRLVYSNCYLYLYLYLYFYDK